MRLDAIWYGPERFSYSCCHMLNETLDGAGAIHHSGFGLSSEHPPFPKLEGAVVIFHGGNEALHGRGPVIASILSAEVMSYSWVIFVNVGDEAGEFDMTLLKHPNMRTWFQTPKPGKSIASRYLIEGYPSDQRGIMTKLGPQTRDLDWFFAGQCTHQRRFDCVKALKASRPPVVNDARTGGGITIPIRSVLITTQSFGAGLSHETYYSFMLAAKVVPCPSGPATPDSFRMAEALEAGCVPVIDACALDGVGGYWEMVFGREHPFWVITDWAEFPEILAKVLANWEAETRACQFFWRRYKLEFRQWLIRDLINLGAI
jgi:hypothetical protein